MERTWHVSPLLCLIQFSGRGLKFAIVATLVALIMIVTRKIKGNLDDSFWLALTFIPLGIATVALSVNLFQAYRSVGILSRAVFVHGTLEDIRVSESREYGEYGKSRTVASRYRVVVSLRDDKGNEWTTVQDASMPDSHRFGDAIVAVHDARDRTAVLLPEYMPGKPEFTSEGTVRATEFSTVLALQFLWVALLAGMVAALLWPVAPSGCIACGTPAKQLPYLRGRCPRNAARWLATCAAVPAPAGHNLAVTS